MYKLILAVCFFNLVTVDSALMNKRHENMGLSTIDLIKKYGYPVENYYVDTEDEYKVNLVRIPHSAKKCTQRRPVVYIQHGLACSTDDFLILGPNYGLAFLLSDQGYDVWMGNSRGNKYSVGHNTLDTDSLEYWDFSFHEIGLYDLPAFIDKALAVSGQKSLSYIGFSQGTTVSYVLLSEKPEYNDKLRILISLAPVAFMSHIKCVVCRIFATNPVYPELIQLLELKQIRPNEEQMNTLFNLICADKKLDACKTKVFNFLGKNPIHMNTSVIPLIASVMPAGSSAKQFLHLAQLIKSAKFRQYDYEMLNNFRHYGSSSPPDYKLDNIRAPVALYYALNDRLSSPIDVKLLKNKLYNVVEYRKIQHPGFSHIDFLWANHVKKYVYDHIIKTLKKFN